MAVPTLNPKSEALIRRAVAEFERRQWIGGAPSPSLYNYWAGMLLAEIDELRRRLTEAERRSTEGQAG